MVLLPRHGYESISRLENPTVSGGRCSTPPAMLKVRLSVVPAVSLPQALRRPASRAIPVHIHQIATLRRRAVSPHGKELGQVTMAAGFEPVSLKRNPAHSGKVPEFLALTVLPELGMNLCQIRALFPELGEIDVLVSPSAEQVADAVEGKTPPFSWGGAILLPFANRIRGQLLPGGRNIATDILNRRVELPANWSGKRPGAEKCSMHGLILHSRIGAVEVEEDKIRATYDAGDFGGHWLSRTRLSFEITLGERQIDVAVTASNTGSDVLPMGVGWHPYFALPSGKREQARIRLPAQRRLLVNNYDDVFPIGQIVPVAGTNYDFSPEGGSALGSKYFDDCFVDLEKTPQGHAVVEIRDPQAHYGLRLTALSREVKALQLYAPPHESFVAIEPQFNWADPFSPVWPRGLDTGMALLAPGEKVQWAVRCELFVVSSMC